MDSNQLNCYAKILKIADFLGVYASDELSSIPTLETGMLIFNTDPSKKSGEHWIGLCINKEYIFYFDSLHHDFQYKKEIRFFDQFWQTCSVKPVSYTHLTLPTILLE